MTPMSKELEFKIMNLLIEEDSIKAFNLLRYAKSYHDLYDTLQRMSKNKQISIYDDEHNQIYHDKIITFSYNVKYYNENI